MRLYFSRRVLIIALALPFILFGAIKYAHIQKEVRQYRKPFPQLENEPQLDAASARNVVLIVMDTLRADRMSINGYPKPTTPYLDSMQDQFLVFRNAHSAAPWTIPSHASLLTGLLPAQHHAHWGHLSLDRKYETVAEELAKENFCNIALAANRFVSAKHFQLLQGFQYVFAPEFPDSLGIITELQNTLSNMAGLKCRRFILLNFMSNHAPYEIGSFGAQFGVRNEAPLDEHDTKWRINAGEISLSTDQLTQLGARYDASVRRSDEILEQVLKILKRFSLLENSIVIITSDHGEGLGDHGEIGHELTAWEEQLHVPLLIRFPNAERHGVVDQTVSTAWLTPSVLKWLGVAPSKAFEGAFTLEDPNAPVLADYRSYFSENARVFNTKVREKYPKLVASTPHQHLYYADGYKLRVDSNQKVSFYHIAIDPHEMHEISQAEPDRLKAYLSAYQALLADGKFTPFSAALDPPDNDEKRRRKNIEVLNSLGYL